MPSLSLGFVFSTALRPPDNGRRSLLSRLASVGKKSSQGLGVGFSGGRVTTFLVHHGVDSGLHSANMRPETRRKVGGTIGPDAEFSEELLTAKVRPMQRRRTVAGIDQDELLEPSLLADPDSCFYEFNGVHIHHKICNAEDDQVGDLVDISVQGEASNSHSRDGRLGLPMILLHGFGASVFSWSRVMKPLASLVGSKILAFDRPAFGLTSRVHYPHKPSSTLVSSAHLNPYSMAFSVLVTLCFMNLLMADKAILLGHSAGCLVAVEAYFQAPERVAALILVAPAIVAPLVSSNPKKESSTERENVFNNRDSVTNGLNFYRFCAFLFEIYLQVKRAIIWMIKGLMNLISYAYKKLLSAILRSHLAIFLVRLIIDRFGVAAVRNAWYDANKATEHDVNGYTKPLRVKGWDKALLEFTIAMLVHTETEQKTAIKNRLSDITCPVLIITGDNDRLVPAWNAKRLSQAIPGSQLEVIKDCGHLPHEEQAEEFLSAVRTFLSRAFSIQSHDVNTAAA
ncbi:2-hydroxy-6-oxononadienedioate/2-hydroxy-6-oxononatrienedioate hydrolase [Nymphaea thermarum]|nr:2-hydroxy-6-oxononadienedioate/2-hydroxy-6-oxononatrienedioate hydrolase [Nymphaea thermarum]